MERSENGMFSLNLRLYPGRYEVIICPFTPNHLYAYILW